MPAEPLIPAELIVDRDAHHRPNHNPQTFARRRSLSNSLMMEASVLSSRSAATLSGSRGKLSLFGVARRTLGILLLMVTVFLWTLSNFLASYIFSDNTYSKPFFVVYINTSIFAISLIPMVLNYVRKHGLDGLRNAAVELWREQRRRGLTGGGFAKLHGEGVVLVVENDDDDDRDDGGEDRRQQRRVGEGRGSDGGANERLLVDDEPSLELFSDRRGTGAGSDHRHDQEQRLDFRETAWLSLEFCMLWFLANYFASACLEYTSVGSVTILTSTSSVWTLVFCAVMRVESFTLRKAAGVAASLVGVVLISTVDLSGKSDEDRGNFPHKSPGQIAIGDSMAFVSAIIYGLYVTVMKRRVGNEDRVDMPLFFGLVGLINLLLLWPVFIVLHYTKIETFELPPSWNVWGIVILNSISSFLSDLSWAYAMLLTTPLVVTVGLSLTIPLSLVGEMIQYKQYSSWIYWVGAGVVFISFLFINHESHEDEDPKTRRASASGSIPAAV